MCCGILHAAMSFRIFGVHVLHVLKYFVFPKVEEKLAELEKVKDPRALLAAFKSLGVDLMSLAKLSGARQAVSVYLYITSGIKMSTLVRTLETYFARLLN